MYGTMKLEDFYVGQRLWHLGQDVSCTVLRVSSSPGLIVVEFDEYRENCDNDEGRVKSGRAWKSNHNYFRPLVTNDNALELFIAKIITEGEYKEVIKSNEKKV